MTRAELSRESCSREGKASTTGGTGDCAEEAKKLSEVRSQSRNVQYGTVGFLGSKCGSKSRVCEQVEKAFRFNRLVDPNRYRTYDNEETLKHGLNDLLPLWV